MEARLTGIDREETLRYLRYRGGTLPEEAEAEVQSCMAEIQATARPRAVWRIFPLGEDALALGTDFRPEGQDIRRMLSGCDRMILMAATLGAEVDALVRRSQVRQMGRAMILDAAASAAIENVCDNLCADLEQALRPEYLTDRFSPGYGDLPLRHQFELAELLNLERRIGVTLTDSGLMLPQKSVTALLGVSPLPQPRRATGCAGCRSRETCPYRKEGTSCGKI